MRKILEGLKGGVFKKLAKLIVSVKFIAGFAVLLLAGSYTAWQYHVARDADRVFWGMLDNSFQTSAYSRHATQKSGPQSLDQVIQTKTSPEQLVYSQSILTQTGADSAEVVTENIATPVTDHVRYTKIDLSKQRADGTPYDFSSIIGVWGRQETTDGITSGDVYTNAALGFIPTANLPADVRKALIKEFRESGALSYTLLKTSTSGPFKRPELSYQVSIDPAPYITVLKKFATATGLNHLEDLNPEDYKAAKKLTFTVAVDGWSKLLTRTTQSSGREEIVSGHNLKKALPAVPAEAISQQELELRLQSIQ